MNWCPCALVQAKKSVGIYILCWVFVGGPSLQRRDDLIIITSSLGVLRGGVNAQWVTALLGDMEHFVVLRDNKVCVGLVRWGKTKASPAKVWMKSAPERERCSVYCSPAFRDVLFVPDLFCHCLFSHCCGLVKWNVKWPIMYHIEFEISMGIFTYRHDNLCECGDEGEMKSKK